MRNILIIDDDIILKSLASQLELFFEFKVTFIQDYRQVNSELEKNYDAIILDIMMPILDSYFSEDEMIMAENGNKTGLVLFDKIRLQYPRIPIMLYSYSRGKVLCDECTIVINKPELAQTIAISLNNLIERVS